MASLRLSWELGLGAVWLAVSGLLLVAASDLAPLTLIFALSGMIRPWISTWRAAEGTALRGALAWAAAAIALALLAQFAALNEPLETGRPWTGRVSYLMVLAILAALISVLGARNPGGGAWAILMALLVVVFLIPWLETAGRLRRAQGPGLVELHSPWTLFYGLLVLAGVTNFLPTRYGLAATSLGAGLALEYLGLTRTDWAVSARATTWSAVSWAFALSLWLALWSAAGPIRGRNSLERLWFWFRDHWGVVWALRTAERFNRSAELAGWPSRLTWFGLVPGDGVGELPPEQAEKTLRGLIRRFVTAPRVDSLVASSEPGPCHSDSPGR